MNILLVEDSPEDHATTVRAFERAGVRDSIRHCEDGDEALDYLRRTGAYADQPAPRPDLILLDLNLPGTDGREVLEEIKRDSDLGRIPVIVLTTSSDQRDIDKCYRVGANTYIQKPVDLDNFFRAIAELKKYWFEIAALPRGE
jgi:CheY-like chemotaxis protein